MEKVESKVDIDARNLALIQKWIELENIWKSQENSRPRRQSTCSTASYSTTATAAAAAASFDHLLLPTSPRTLMSSLQQRNPAFRNKNCSNAVEEILMDRRAAIMSGRFKGRQLFAAAETASSEESTLSHSYSGGGDTCNDWVDEIDQERELMATYDGCEERYDLSWNFSESCPLPEEKAVVEAAEKRGGDGRREEKDGGRRAATVSLGAVLIVLAFVLCCLSCHGNNAEEFILVPT